MVGFQLRLTLIQIKLHASMNLLFIIQSSTLIAMERSTSTDECCSKQVLLACYSKQLLRSNFVILSHRQPSKYSIFHKTRCCKMYTQQPNVINKSSDLLTDLICILQIVQSLGYVITRAKARVIISVGLVVFSRKT